MELSYTIVLHNADIHTGNSSSSFNSSNVISDFYFIFSSISFNCSSESIGFLPILFSLGFMSPVSLYNLIRQYTVFLPISNISTISSIVLPLL